MLETMGIYVMGVIFVISVLAKMISYVTVRRMVRAASEIQKSNHRFMKLVKAKFEHASMVSDKVKNVEAFVDKHLYEYRILGIKLCTLQHFPKKGAWLVGVLGALFVMLCYNETQFSILTVKYIEWTCIFALSLVLLQLMLEEKLRIRAAKNYIVEYLENVCVRRYEKANQEVRHEEVREPEETVIPVEEPEPRRKTDQEIRIRAILEEFMA